MIDFDGTLVPIEDRPEFVVPSVELLNILKGLAGKKRVIAAIISGRNLKDLKRLVNVNGISLIGCHGAETTENAENSNMKQHFDKIQAKLDRIEEAASDCIGKNQGFIIERKIASVALHYRLAEAIPARTVINKFTAVVSGLMGQELTLLKGKKVLEVRSILANKGLAVKQIMNKKKNYFPVYIGDDITDEDAFDALGNFGLGILVTKNNSANTAASCRLRNPEEVMRFLKKIQLCTY